MNEPKYRVAERRLWESVGLEPKEHFIDLQRIGNSSLEAYYA